MWANWKGRNLHFSLPEICFGQLSADCYYLLEWTDNLAVLDVEISHFKKITSKHSVVEK